MQDSAFLRVVKDKSQVKEPKRVIKCSFLLLLEIGNAFQVIFSFLRLRILSEECCYIVTAERRRIVTLFLICSHQFLATYVQVHKKYRT